MWLGLEVAKNGKDLLGICDKHLEHVEGLELDVVALVLGAGGMENGNM